MSKQNIYMAMGSLAYAIAKADGTIQKEEITVIRKNAQEILLEDDISHDFIDEMFDTLEKKDITVEDAFNYALDVLKENKYDYDFYDSIKHKCIIFLEAIAESFQGATTKETALIERFKLEISQY